MHEAAGMHLIRTCTVLGFVVCLLLYAALLLQDMFACTVRMLHMFNMCVGRTHKRGLEQ